MAYAADLGQQFVCSLYFYWVKAKNTLFIEAICILGLNKISDTVCGTWDSDAATIAALQTSCGLSLPKGQNVAYIKASKWQKLRQV
jgi:hypothetical protein